MANGASTPTSPRFCDFKDVGSEPWQVCLPVLDQVVVDCGEEQLGQLGQQWCFRHARLVSDKLYAGPCAKRSEGWARQVATGRLALNQLIQHQQDLLAAEEAANKLEIETVAREASHLQRGEVLRQELEEYRQLLGAAGAEYADLAVR